MIIPIYVEKDSFLHLRDEKKLLSIEDERNVIFAIKSAYNNIKILDSSIGRILLFDDTYQGGIINYDRFKGGMPYTRYYHLSKTLNQNIKNILILGLGSGSLVLDCNNIYDYECIDIVEIDPVIIDLSKKYFGISEDKLINFHCEDAKDFVFNTDKTYDLIIVDIFLAQGMPFKFMALEFIERLYKILAPRGIAGVNLFGTENIESEGNEIFRAEYKTYKEVFNSLYTIPVLYGAYEFFRFSCNLRYRLGKLTNILLLASKDDNRISKRDFVAKAKSLQNNTSLSYLKNYSFYARDLYEHTISTDDVKIITDNFKVDSNFDNFLQLIKY